jgi:glycosyltransferase involved in cell wall biosynthesis
VTRPAVSVVVPFYQRQDQLDRLLVGLDRQTLPSEAFELVVADDGSAHPPVGGRRAYSSRIVRQPDDGFRLARARNLGATATTGRVVAFLDQDCVPTPEYLQLVATAVTTPWSLVVGHRLHVCLDDCSPGALGEWLDGDGPPLLTLPEPAWLLDGYARTSALTRPDDHAYQLVIGAALSLHRHLYDHLGGFDPDFHAYGGEDWELGHRALTAGADLRWLDDARVWHDGPDLAGRAEDLVSTKNTETLSLAARIPDHDVRGRRLVWRIPGIIVRLHAAGASLATVVAAIDSLLNGADAHVWVDGPLGREVVDVLEDPRVHVGAPSAAVLARSRYQVDCVPVLLRGGTLHDLEPATPTECPGFRMVRLRDANRRRRGIPWPTGAPWPSGVEISVLDEVVPLERHWQQERLATDRRRLPRLTEPVPAYGLATSTRPAAPGSPTPD